ncbi:MtrAB system histidine kinase MtrB [Streptoalloteichus tenebrarius]|uniref:MtrAB system histidine kinase MtrB n=1 Tax=Streptoalloteichus tenebrarius (strain ATCC 17920 / DSM 40477 / JCM 4838 / CBS 697.72 / NBRC 16177 / NCIMB 11028 / NRRL B-12390 / A12253. 1 / ISP 5477) TaxID=1933 RepID=UPI0035586E28
MRRFGARLARKVARRSNRLAGEVRRRWAAFGALWRRSLQLRVVVSTLALSSAVVFVLGMVLQTQITDRLLSAKRQAAISQTESSASTIERELVAVNPDSDNVEAKLTNAVNKLVSPSGDDQANAAAGAFEPVLADGRRAGDGLRPSVTGPFTDVPPELRKEVEREQFTTQYTTVERATGRSPVLAVGIPVRSAGRSLQLYLLFPLDSEQRTISLVQNTLVVVGLLLLLLLAGIANLVTRQVVRPVRQAAEVAERFADGQLDERMPVVGEDDVARLAESFNEMAASIQRQIRQLEEFGQLQRQFTSDVSHELRTPLTTVRMAADVLHASREQFPEGLARSTELMVDELDRFEALLADLLEISRLDAGVADLAAEPVDVRGIVLRVVDSLRPIAEKAGVAIVLRTPGEGPTGETGAAAASGPVGEREMPEVTAEVDGRRVERILRNLLANAVDHGEGQPIEVWLAADDRAVAVAVRDHGVGLRPGEEELVFTRFWRADPSRNRRTGGTGLGLSISLEDARLHGGWLEAWGEPGAGACFRLTVPRRQGEELTGSPLPLPPDAPARDQEEETGAGDPAELAAGRQQRGEAG